MGHDGKFAHCSREELAGGLPVEKLGTYAHRLEGSCKCGETHGDEPVGDVIRMPRAAASSTVNGTRKRACDCPREAYVEVERWPYESGIIVVRAHCPHGEKTYFQRHLTVDGREEKGIGTCARVLYRESEVRAADPRAFIFFVEGEKCAELLRARGLLATTTLQGSSSWGLSRERAIEVLRRKNVVILPDHDAPGRAHGAAVQADLVKVCASLRVLELPGLGDREDVEQWFDRGGDPEDLVKMAEARPNLAERRLLVAAEAARVLWSKPLPPAQPTGIGGLDAAIRGLRAESIAVLNGPTGRGKTGLALQSARHVARQREVIYLTSELSERQVLARTAAQVLGVPWLRLYELGPFGTDEMEAALHGLALHVVELRRGAVLRDVLDRAADDLGVAPVLYLDYLQHAARRLATDDLRLATGRLVDELTTWARDARSTALVISSVGRGFHKADPDASAEDFLVAGKEAGEIEYDASAVLFLAAQLPPEGGLAPAQLHVSKHRFGPSGQTIGLQFNGAVGLFVDDPGAALSELELDCYRAVADGVVSQEKVRELLKVKKERVARAMRSLKAKGLIDGPPFRVLRSIS